MTSATLRTPWDALPTRPGSGAADALSEAERRRITLRLGAGLAGASLLGLGTAFIHMAPGAWQVGEMLRGMAALVVGTPLLASGIRGMVTGDARKATDQLVALAILAAAASGDFVTATLIPLFLEVGRLFEERSSLGAQAAIDGIRALAARQASRWRGGQEERVDLAALATGDEILVRPGERIPVDGTVLVGTAAVDQSPVTGESSLEDVGPGSPVFAGTVATDGLLRVEVRGTGSHTVLGRVVDILAEMEHATVPLLRTFERRAGAWLPLVLTLAATTLFFTQDLSRAIAVVVVATPTALVVAGPAAMVAAMTTATRLRTLLKSTDFLERMAAVDTLVLDKTGTVTVGAPGVEEIHPSEGVSVERLLAVAATCGFGSLHPVSRALVGAARTRGVAFASPAQLQERPGVGVVAEFEGQQALLGRRSLLEEMGVPCTTGPVPGEGSEHGREAREEPNEGVWVALGGRCLGRLVVRDLPRAEARDALDGMRDLGIERVILLTGDRAETAHRVGELLGVDQVLAGVLPEQKLELVRAEQADGHVVMMVGDGVNDALALRGADVGVAIGAEVNEVALGGADVALLGTDLRRLPHLVEFADLSRRVLDQNVWTALGAAVLLIALAAGGVLDPLAGALAQSVAVAAVVVNSARILRFRRGSGVR
jgi:heavy metal translocating P-type ATPase